MKNIFQRASVLNLPISKLATTLLIVGLTTFSGTKAAFSIGEVYPQSGFSPAIIQDLKWSHDAATVSQTYLSNIIKPAINQWNGASTKHKNTYVTGTPNMRVLISNAAANAAGEMIPYCSSGNGYPACVNNGVPITWSAARIYGYDAAMTGAGYTTTNKTKVYAHEMGHVLSMDHVYISSPALMLEGPQNYGVQQYDRDNLKYKWKIKTMKCVLIAIAVLLSMSGSTFANASSRTSQKPNQVPATTAKPVHSPQREFIGKYPVVRTHASFIVPESLEDMANKAELIVIGRATKSLTDGVVTLPRDSEGFIVAPYTEVPFKVNKVFKGNKDLKEIRLGQPAALIQEPGQKPHVRIMGDYTPVEPNKKYLMFLIKGTPGSGGENLYFAIGVVYGQHALTSDSEEKAHPTELFKQIRKLARQQYKE